MSKVCQICFKRPLSGNTIKRRGLAKKKGGVGRKITGITKRKFKPNLQRIKVKLDGSIKTLRVCVQCLKKAKLQKVI
jgi:large subunit ribosomal protein L28